jgi:hypothetical protein
MPELRNNNKDLIPLTPAAPLAETPATEIKELPPAAPVDDLKDVRFDARQQLRLDQILKESHGRVGSAQRAEITRLKSEMARIQNEKDEANEPLPEVELLRARLAAEQARSQALIEDRVKLDRENLVNRLAQKHDFVKPEIVATLTQANLKWSPSSRSFEVVDNDGQPRLDSDFNPLSPDAFMAQFAIENPFLVRGRTASGAGSTSSQSSTLGDSSRLNVAEIFGRDSIATKAAALMKANPRAYAQAKIAAKRLGLI